MPAARPFPPRGAWAGGLLLGLALTVLLQLWKGHDYWNFSEGVYLLSARLMAAGHGLYHGFAGAQPPGVFLAGAGLLGLHDGIGFVRGALGLVQLGAGALAAVATWRLSGSRLATALAPALALLTPWATHEHGQLTPEVLAPPLLLGGALLAARPRTAAAGGALAAVAVAVKYPFLLPVAGIVAFAPERRRTALGAGAALIALALAGQLVYGSALWRDTIGAQLGSGRHTIRQIGQLGVQEAWGLAGLLLAAGALLLAGRRRVRDPLLGRVWVGLTLGVLATGLTVVKRGTVPNVVLPIEAALVPPALAGVALLAVRPRPRALAAAGIALALAQSASLVISPRRTAFPFVYPGSQRGAWGVYLSTARLDAQVARARRCPPARATSFAPYVAFLARRPAPGGEPDTFLLSHAGGRLDAALVRVNLAHVRCP